MTTQPANTTVQSGKKVTFTVAANNSVASCTWQVSKNGGSSWSNVNQTKYPSAATASLSFTTSASLNGYQYRCILVFSDGSSITSNAAKLTVN